MNHKKLKILIISCYFPPLNLISSMRPYSWAKYWSRLGHEICVLTVKKEALEGSLIFPLENDVTRSVRIEELPVPYKLFKKYVVKQNPNRQDLLINKRLSICATIRRLIRTGKQKLGNITGIDPYSPHVWILPAVKKAAEIYEQWPFDIMVSTYSPPASHIIAGILKRKLGTFWVADYRDLWYGNHYESGIWPFSFFEKCIEDFFVKKADLFTTVSDPWKEKLMARFGNKVITIENGFDTEELDKIGSEYLFPYDNKVRLVYMGRVYPWKQDPSPLFEAVCILKSRGIPAEDKLEIVFYGMANEYLQHMIAKYNMEGIVKTPGYVDRETSLKVQRDADMLVFLDWPDPKVGFFSGKLFEYIHSGAPILNIGVSADTLPAKLIEAAGVGITVANAPEKIADIIETLIKGGRLNYSPSQEVLEKYTRKGLAEKMLEDIIKHFDNIYTE